VLENPFPDPRYVEFSFGGMGPGGFGGNFTFGQWLTPSIGMGTTLLIVYIVVFFALAALLFKRRQL
jgi:ABC-type transport system involved in multi-copper enzyme maturation permease subunit